MTAPKPIGLHVRLTPEQAATLDRLIADGGDPEATRSRIVRQLIDGAANAWRAARLDPHAWRAARLDPQWPAVHSCTNAAPCPRCSS